MRFVVIVFTIFFYSISALGQQTKIVVIDPGHGGHDSGAIGVHGLLEKDIVLSIALETVARHSLAGKNHLQIYLTRYTDTFVNLNDRSTIPKVLKADLFFSLHCNSSIDPDARGIEVYLNEQNNVFMAESLVFATNLENEFKSLIGFESRGIKCQNFQVINNVSSICMSVLLEMGFLSNRDEAGYLENNITTIAVALLKAINKNLGL